MINVPHQKSTFSIILVSAFLLVVCLITSNSIVYGQDIATMVPESDVATEIQTTPVPESPTPLFIFTETQQAVQETEEPTQELATPTVEALPSDTPEILPTEQPTQVTSFETIYLKINAGMRRSLKAALPASYHYQTDPVLQAVDVVLIQVPIEEKEQALKDLSALPQVAYVEEEQVIHALETIPDDPLVSQQYALSSIRAYTAWDYLPPSSDAPVIAVVDTGVDLSHPEFSGKIQPGYDFYNEDSIPQDDNGHGTHVAGIAAGSGNNATGIAGICWDADILPVKVLDRYGDGTYDLVARGIIWATDHGAEIINLSLGGSYQSQVLADAVDYALARGVLLVAASGNAGEAGVYYPAAYSGVIAVGAVDQSNSRAYFSNYGPELDLTAPGVSILSTHTGGGYTYRSGTSMSTPMVTGSIALLSEILGYSPYSALYILEETAQDLGVAGLDSFYGYGLIRLDRAVNWSPVTPTSVLEPTNQSGQNTSSAGWYFSSTVSIPTPSSTVISFITPTPSITPKVETLVQGVSPETKISVSVTNTYTATLDSEEIREASSKSNTNPWLGWLLIVLGSSLWGIKKIWFDRKPDLR